MANFTTHIASGILVSGALSTLAIATSVATPGELMTLVGAGALGAVLPDIDLQQSRASQAMFSGLAIFFAFAMLFKLALNLSIIEMLIIWIATYVAVRYLGHNAFHKIAVHRGIFHSIVAAVFFGFATAIVYRQVFQTTPLIAWMGGIFMFVGYIVHLVLDEIYSVDVYNERVKSSFGSALKLIDHKHAFATVAMLAVTGATYFVTPPVQPLAEVFGTNEVWVALGDRMLPHGPWFNGIGDKAARMVGLTKSEAAIAPAADATASTTKLVK